MGYYFKNSFMLYRSGDFLPLKLYYSNSDFIIKPLINADNSPTLRIDFNIAVPHDVDFHLVKKILTELVLECESVADKKYIEIYLLDYDRDALNIMMHLMTTLDVYFNIQHEVRTKILEKFREHNIMLPGR